MSRFTVIPIESQPPAARDATVIGAQYDAFEASSANVNQENWAEEGLTARSFATDPDQLEEDSKAATVTTNFAQPYAGAFGQLVLNAVQMRVTPATLSIAAGEVIRVLSYLNLQFAPQAGFGLPGDLTLQFQHVLNNGATVKIPASEWRRDYKRGAGPNDGHDLTGFTVPIQGRSARVRMESLIVGPVVTFNWAELQYKFTTTGAGTSVDIFNGFILLDRFKRVGVL